VNGEIFRKQTKRFLPGDLLIPYHLYFDDFEIDNPLGSHKISICGAYIIFPKIPQYLLSKLQYIFPTAFISTADIKQYGVERSLYHLIEELKLLKQGVDVHTSNGSQVVRFTLGAVLGDNLAVNTLAGFVQSFNSNYYCRACKRSKFEMQFDALERQDYLRNPNNYNTDLLLGDPQRTGIKANCVFHEIENFHITERNCFDLMHDVFEGVCKYDLCIILLGLI